MEHGDIIDIPPESYAERLAQMGETKEVRQYFWRRAREIRELLAVCKVDQLGTSLPLDIECYLEATVKDLNVHCPFVGRPVRIVSAYHAVQLLGDDGAPVTPFRKDEGDYTAYMTHFKIQEYDFGEVLIEPGLAVCSVIQSEPDTWLRFETPLNIGSVTPLLPVLN